MKWLGGAFLCLFVVHGASALRCFQCNSYNDTACADEFRTNSAAIQDAFLITCESRENEEPFCRKSKTYFETVTEIRVQRDCGYLEREGYECYQKRAEDYVLDVCQCKEDLCNSAPLLSADRVVTAVLAMFMPLIMAFI